MRKIGESHVLFYIFPFLLPQLSNSDARDPKDKKTLKLTTAMRSLLLG